MRPCQTRRTRSSPRPEQGSSAYGLRLAPRISYEFPRLACVGCAIRCSGRSHGAIAERRKASGAHSVDEGGASNIDRWRRRLCRHGRLGRLSALTKDCRLSNASGERIRSYAKMPPRLYTLCTLRAWGRPGESMKTCTRCGLTHPDSSSVCECGGALVVGDHKILPEGRVAGFWIRLGSDLIDAVVLGAIGWFLASVFRAPLLQLGERGVLLGIPISLLYTGILQSEIGKGQTLAKRLLGLRVLRLDGRYLSLDRSLVRWSIMGFMCYGGSAAYTLGFATTVFQAQTIASAISGMQLALILGCVFLVPFHPLKRGLHDLLAGSIVIRAGTVPTAAIDRGRNPRRDRFLVIGAIAVAVVGTVSGTFLWRSLPQQLQDAANLMAAMSEIGIENPGISDLHIDGPTGHAHNLVATGYLPSHADGTAKIADAEVRVLAAVRKHMPTEGVDKIVVTLRKGINIGVYSKYEFGNRVEPPVPAPSGN